MYRQKRLGTAVDIHHRDGKDMSTMSASITRELGELKASISEVQAEIRAIDRRFDEVIVTQLKDHGKRLAALEVSEHRRKGAVAGFAALFGVIGSLATLVGAAIAKFFF